MKTQTDCRYFSRIMAAPIGVEPEQPVEIRRFSRPITQKDKSFWMAGLSRSWRVWIETPMRCNRTMFAAH